MLIVLDLPAISKESLKRWNEIMMLTWQDYREENGAQSKLYRTLMGKISNLEVYC